MNPVQVHELLKQARAYAANSTCTERQVGAALWLPSGNSYLGTNGIKGDACNRYCEREAGPDPLEYLTCPSPCAETATIIGALADNCWDPAVTRDGVIVSTDFPCERCVDVMSYAGIGELYFEKFKRVDLRVNLNLAILTRNGIVVNQVLPEGLQSWTSDLSDMLARGPAMAAPMRGTFHLQRLLDPKWRAKELATLREIIAVNDVYWRERQERLGPDGHDDVERFLMRAEVE